MCAILHAFTRASAAGDLLLHHRDDESKLLAPHLPTPYGEPQPRFNLVDRALPSYGDHTWQISAMDLFGRLSPAAAISAEVRDTISPPAPATVDVQLLGDATTGPSWTTVAITFDWLPTHEAVAPDLAAFEIHLRQGVVSSSDATLPATWGRFETTPGSVAGAVTIAWPSLAVSNPAAGSHRHAVGCPDRRGWQPHHDHGVTGRCPVRRDGPRAHRGRDPRDRRLGEHQRVRGGPRRTRGPDRSGPCRRSTSSRSERRRPMRRIAHGSACRFRSLTAGGYEYSAPQAQHCWRPRERPPTTSQRWTSSSRSVSFAR